MRNFTPPAWLPEQTYGCSKWYIATLLDLDNGKVYARQESIGGVDCLVGYGELGSVVDLNGHRVTLEPEYYTDIDWSTFDATFDKGGVTFAKENDNGE